MEQQERLYNTVGAAKYLDRTIDNVHQRVRSGSLKAYCYNAEGVLVERPAGPISDNRGQGLYFYEHDLEKYRQTKMRKRKEKTCN